MPSSALTRWLKQGLARGMCPLCRVAHKADREYVWHFFEDGSRTEAGLDALRAARGFCREHAEMLRRLEVEGLGSTLGISEIYEDAFEGIADELDALDAGARGEAPGPERDSWERALRLTGGWPPPGDLVGRPEGDGAGAVAP